jgi:hypothetical protein
VATEVSLEVTTTERSALAPETSDDRLSEHVADTDASWAGLSQAEVLYLHHRFPGRFAAGPVEPTAPGESPYGDGGEDPDEDPDDEALVLAALGDGVTSEQVRRAMLRLFEAKKKRDLVIVATFLDLWETQGPDPSDAHVAEASGLPHLTPDEVRHTLLWFRNRLGS